MSDTPGLHRIEPVTGKPEPLKRAPRVRLDDDGLIDDLESEERPLLDRDIDDPAARLCERYGAARSLGDSHAPGLTLDARRWWCDLELLGGQPIERRRLTNGSCRRNERSDEYDQSVSHRVQQLSPTPIRETADASLPSDPLESTPPPAQKTTKMKLDASQTATLVANIGVIVGIAFLAYEMRQNTIAVRSASAQGVQDQIVAVYDMLMDDSMADIMLRGMPAPEALSPQEMAKFQSFWTTAMQAFQNTFVQVNEGAYDASLAAGWWQLLRNNFESPGFLLHWNSRRFLLSPEFQEFVESEVMAMEPTPEYSPLGVDQP